MQGAQQAPFGLGTLSKGPWGSLRTSMSGQLSRALAPEALAGLKSTLRALGTGRAWMPTACNAATCTAFAASMYLATALSDTPYVLVFALAPMLLLLCYDPVMQYYVGDSQVRYCLTCHASWQLTTQRYLPPAAAISLYLIMYGVMETLAGWLATMGEAGHAAAVAYAFKNSMLLGLPLPNHVLFLVFLSQQHGRLPGGWMLQWHMV